MFETIFAIWLLLVVVALFVVVTSRFEFGDPFEEDEHAQGLEPWWLRGKK